MTALERLAAGQLERIEELQRENIPQAAWAVLTSRERFVALFKDHRRRAHEAMQLMMSMPVRGMIADDTPKGIEIEATDALTAIRAGLTRGFMLAVAALMVAVGAAYALGAVKADLPVHFGKCLQTAGATFALWGTLLALSGPEGVSHSVPRRVHSFIFSALLSLGGALAMIGTLL